MVKTVSEAIRQTNAERTWNQIPIKTREFSFSVQLVRIQPCEGPGVYPMS